MTTISDYSPRDYDTTLARLKELARKNFTDPEGRSLWTDFDAPTVENTLLKLMAWYGDLQGFMRDNYIGEASGWTVKRKENLLVWARLFNYTLTGPGYASVDVTFSIDAAHGEDVLVPADTLLTVGNIRYRTVSDVTITAGETEADGSAMQITHRTETIASTDKVDQEVALSYKGYVDGSMQVSTAAGAWTRVDSFVGSDADDLHYKVFRDEEFRPIVVFGDGANGAVPEGDVTYTYDTTLGPDGRVSAGRLAGSVTVPHGVGTIDVDYENAEASKGGTQGMGTGEAKARLPDHIRTGDQLVTRTDYEAAAEAHADVARAYLLTRQDYGGAGVNHGILGLVAKGATLDRYTLPAAPTASIIADVVATVEAGRIVTFDVDVQAAPFLTVDVETTLYVDDDYDEQVVADAVYGNLRKHFAVMKPDGSDGDVSFGISYKRDPDDPQYGLFPWSHLFNVVRDTEGVEHVPPAQNSLVLNGYHEDVKLPLWKFPVLGSVKITSIATSKEYEYGD